jgi:hypothetical protein
MPETIEVSPKLSMSIKDMANYRGHPEGKLDEPEITALFKQVEDGMATLNGDTAPCTLTARQLVLLLNHTIRTVARNEQAARKLVCDAERCPDRAIRRVYVGKAL